jgi:hypothetical protein
MWNTQFHSCFAGGTRHADAATAICGLRGPVARDPVERPSGYRVTDQVRAELQMAASSADRSSLQAVIDLAVAEFLMRMRRRNGFTVRGHVKVPSGGHEKSPLVATESPHASHVVSAGS